MRRVLVVVLLAFGCGGVEPVAAPAPSGTLYLAGRDPGTLIRVDTATGRVTVRDGLRQMGGGDPPYMVAFTGGRLVTFALGRTSSFAPDLSDPRSLGEAWFYVPSATPGRVWNLLLRRGDPATVVNFRGLREVTVDGRVTFSRRADVPGWAAAAVPAGLVLSGEALKVWDPHRETVVRRLPGPFFIAARGTVVASCRVECRAVHLTDTGTGHHSVVRFSGAYEGVFSPDARLLAVRDEAGRLAVVDVSGGSVRDIGRAVAGGGSLTWASSGWLFYEMGGGRIGAWRPGEPARELPVRVGPFIDMTSD